MKVAYILEGIKPGWLTYEMDALRNIGVEIDINPNNPAVYNDFSPYAGPKKRSLGRDILNLTGRFFGGPFVIRPHFGRMRRYAGWRIAISTIAMARGIKERNAVIIHAHFATGPAASAMVVSELTGIPFAFTGHGYDLYREPIDWGFQAEKCRRAAFVRCISEFNRRHLMGKTGLDGGNFHVVPCGVDTERFRPDGGADSTPDGDRIILTVAALVPPKGIPFLLKACSSDKVKRLNRKLVIVGDGPMRDLLTREASRLNIDVEFAGEVKNSEIMEYYRRADLFVLPCITAPDGHHDGIPVAMMEAMAAGVPVISTNISGIPELVDNEKSGILVGEKDTKALAEAIERLLTDGDLRRRFSVEGRKRVVEKFNIVDVAGRLKNLFMKHSVRGA
ncbi:MAG: glycosyltransferase family 4 protein [Deltaproteobacteria bacterium]|uniref:Glycosyltransferase family 4 protein n=1 Tax=Candidatus Zymogenus saltonus TaxID=2844893 RepID=A0A9D8KE42_9DELT|nr:glycosyltransferase family 4 protein [Candidatus Zymogenus saltonus]